jgi:hypothetical protein
MEEFLVISISLLVLGVILILVIVAFACCQQQSEPDQIVRDIGIRARNEMDIESEKFVRDIFERFCESYEIDQKEIENG